MTSTTGPGPIRSCVGCRRRASPSQLIRVARRPDGSLAFDRTGSGRGAWLCAVEGSGAAVDACVECAGRRQAFTRAFRAAVEAEAVASLRAMSGERARMEGATPVARRDGKKGLT